MQDVDKIRSRRAVEEIALMRMSVIADHKKRRATE